MSGPIVDTFVTYQFIKRLATPFEKWDAYKYGIIDKDGKVLRKSASLKTQEEKNSWRYFDRLVANLKKLLGKVPGGKTRIASYAAALLLLREEKYLSDLDDDQLEQVVESMLPNYISLAQRYITEEGEAVAPANNVGGGKIAAVGIGPQGDPPAKLRNKKNQFNIIKSIARRKAPNV
jgi:hypothetical protein